MKQKREFKIVGHYMMVNGEKVAIDPLKIPDLADRCKLAAETIRTGDLYKIVKDVNGDES